MRRALRWWHTLFILGSQYENNKLSDSGSARVISDMAFESGSILSSNLSCNGGRGDRV